MEPMNFNLDEDFKITIGKEKQEIIIPRLMFKNVRKFLNKLSESIAEDRNFSLSILGKVKEADILRTSKSFDLIGKFLKTVIPELVEKQNLTIIKGLLFLISENIITEKHLDVMQFNEVVKLLTFLVDKNFESLKNLSASLQVISSSGQKENV